jgi:hypothetical protein
MDVIITIPDDVIVRVINGFAGHYDYQDQVLVDGVLIANPEDKGAFAKRMLIESIKSSVKSYEVTTAVAAAKEAAGASADALNIT